MGRKKYKGDDPTHDAELYGPWTSELRPAPGALRLVQSFVNTRPRRDSPEKLTRPRALANWLKSRGLLGLGAQLDDADLERALTVREGIRALIRADQGGAVDGEAVRRLDGIVSAVPLVLRFDAAGVSSLEPSADGCHGALARLAVIVATARLEDHWPLLRLCAEAACLRAFYDFSPTHNARWCMARCSARIHNRAYRQRRRRQGHA